MNPLLLLLSLAAAQPDPALLAGLEYRQLPLTRGGRSTAVTGVAADPFTFYFGGIGGGVWKSTNAGNTWNNVSDRYFEAGSVGAIAVSDSNPLVVYAGTGTACPRSNVSPGVGVYRSGDGGATWVHAGLRDAGQIGRIRIHPRNPDLVYAAVLGHASAPNATRGVFRSSDGGRSWQKVLFLSERTGIVDLALDPADPRVLYAASWSFQRKPWAFENGGTEGGIFKSEDGGDTWTRLSGGLPSGMLGRTAVTLSPARPSRVWALIEAAGGAGGLFRSEDAGRTWSRVNADPMVTARPYFHTHLTPDPVSPDGIWVLGITLLKSTDGGATFAMAPESHVDHHDLWIHPRDPRILINGNDGGATVSLDGGATWSTQMNQPTGEMYRVAVDTGYPYRVYSAQQDAGAVSVPAANPNMPLELVDVHDVGGGEASNIAVDPRNPSIVYATVGAQGWQIAKTDTARKTSEFLQIYPEPRVGQRAAAMKYRANWNMALRCSSIFLWRRYPTCGCIARTSSCRPSAADCGCWKTSASCSRPAASARRSTTCSRLALDIVPPGTAFTFQSTVAPPSRTTSRRRRIPSPSRSATSAAASSPGTSAVRPATPGNRTSLPSSRPSTRGGMSSRRGKASTDFAGRAGTQCRSSFRAATTRRGGRSARS